MDPDCLVPRIKAVKLISNGSRRKITLPVQVEMGNYFNSTKGRTRYKGSNTGKRARRKKSQTPKGKISHSQK